MWSNRGIKGYIERWRDRGSGIQPMRQRGNEREQDGAPHDVGGGLGGGRAEGGKGGGVKVRSFVSILDCAFRLCGLTQTDPTIRPRDFTTRFDPTAATTRSAPWPSSAGGGRGSEGGGSESNRPAVRMLPQSEEGGPPTWDRPPSRGAIRVARFDWFGPKPGPGRP